MTHCRRTASILFVLLLGLLGGRAAAADRLALTNGDVLTGQLRSVSAADVVFASDLAGTVRVKRSAITRVTREGSDGRVQTLSLNDAGVAGGDDASTPGWHGAVNVDLAMARGNSDTATLSVNGTSARLADGEKLATYGSYLLSTVGPGGGATLARSARGGARYDRDMATRVYAFAFGDLEHDALQLLDLRSVVGGGAGLHVVRSPRVQTNIFSGVSYARDQYAEPVPVTDGDGTGTAPATGAGSTGSTSPPGNASSGKGLAIGRNRVINVPTRTPPAVVNATLSRSVGEYVIGQDLSAQLTDTLSLDQRLVLFPAIKDLADYRVSFDLSLSGALSERWQWHSTVANRYLRIPPSGGAVRNDLFIASGLGLTFGRGDVGGYRGPDARVR